MKFAHLGDCHLGGWRQPELQKLNLLSFQYAVNKCIKENVTFALITGDLFDSAYPPIETLRDTFNEFRKLQEAKIPVFLIAGSHDYSASGKTFLEVLDKAGFCKNVAVFEEHKGAIMLQPTLYKGFALYGYPGKKSGLEVEDIGRIKIQDAPGMFKILMLHTAIKDAVGNLPIPSVDEKKLPKVDYLALSHLHIDYNKDGRVYSGPIFPNNLEELEELRAGSFYIFDDGKIKKEVIKIKEILPIKIEVTNALEATKKIIEKIEEESIADKIVILRLSGILEQGKLTDIDFIKIEAFVRSKGAFSFIKSTSKLHHLEAEIILEQVDASYLEQHILELFTQKNPSKFNSFSYSLLKALQLEKIEEEKIVSFEDRLLSEVKKIIEI
ncbi:MAG: DNA repair exonuclease [Nanoarchaeota archaeon]